MNWVLGVNERRNSQSRSLFLRNPLRPISDSFAVATFGSDMGSETGALEKSQVALMPLRTPHEAVHTEQELDWASVRSIV